MGINIRQKGAEGEREVCKLLNGIIRDVMAAMEFSEDDIVKAEQMVQRNQNQSAVGGCDLSNTFGISFEIKRQEQLSVGTWWAQCVAAAGKNKELPVLMYRQNRKPWRIRTFAFLHVPRRDGIGEGWGSVQAIVEFDIDTFRSWFASWVRGKLECGYDFRV